MGDVSRVTDMKRMFMFAKFFNRDVSSVTNMQGMFMFAKFFNRDMSNWDVSSVTNMQGMFLQASSFNTDISKWDMRSVTDTDYMFYQAESFKQKLCGDSWINSKATNKFRFASSEGTLADKPCSFVSNSRPISSDVGRELIVRGASTTPAATPAANAMECPKCGKFGKSGRVSCCAPGGAWFKKCGSSKNKKTFSTSGPKAPLPAKTNQRKRRRPPSLRAPYAAPSRNRAKRVVVVAVGLGTKTVGVLETKEAKRLATRGSRVSRSANNKGRSTRQPSANLSQALLKNRSATF